MADFQLRSPTLEVPEQTKPHLLPPSDSDLHLDPSLQHATAPQSQLNLQIPPAQASYDAFAHYTDPPMHASAPSPFSAEINPVADNRDGSRYGAYSDGEAKVTKRGPGGLDFSAGVTGAAGGELGGKAGISKEVAPGVSLGVEGGISGTPGEEPQAKAGLKVMF